MADLPQTGGGEASDGYGERQGWNQNVVVMRHGDRIDVEEPLWLARAGRPWDPPLTDAGRIRAWTTGKRLRFIGFPVHRIIVSPFLRCLQTAAEVIAALCCVVEDDAHLLSMETSAGAVIDPSRVKLPSWEEPLAVARERYHTIIEALADKFPHENLLLITHGEAVGVSISSCLEDAIVYQVDYCAYSHLQRQSYSEPYEAAAAAGGGFKLVTSTQAGLLFSC